MGEKFSRCYTATGTQQFPNPKSQIPLPAHALEVMYVAHHTWFDMRDDGAVGSEEREIGTLALVWYAVGWTDGWMNGWE